MENKNNWIVEAINYHKKMIDHYQKMFEKILKKEENNGN